MLGGININCRISSSIVLSAQQMLVINRKILVKKLQIITKKKICYDMAKKNPL